MNKLKMMRLVNASTSKKQTSRRAFVPYAGLFVLFISFWISSVGSTTTSSFIMTMMLSQHDAADSSLSKFAVRVYYAVLFTFGMEFIARYEHKYLWHSNALWFLHASHHHQKTHFGKGPSKNDAESNTYVVPVSQLMELNDIFPVMFASIAIWAMHWAYAALNQTFIHDIVLGTAIGISTYGTSYFIGHDLCAHERGGKKVGDLLRKLSPAIATAADVHTTYHHKVDVGAEDAADPYGAPYGFWLGAEEVKAFQDEKDLGMPLIFKAGFMAGLSFLVYCYLEHDRRYDPVRS